MSLRDDLIEVLRNYGAADPQQGIHGWRCAYPEQYGPCSCVEDLADDLAKVARRHPFDGTVAVEDPDFVLPWVEDL